MSSPAFRRLELRDTVKSLPYEVVEDIDRFFANSSSGISVALIAGMAGMLA